MAINPIKDETLNLFPDNTDGDITASDMRQYIDNIWKDKERKINKYPNLSEAFAHSELYQLDIFLITKEPIQSKNGIYVSLINQPNNETEIVQVANLTKNDVLEVPVYNEMLLLNVNKGDICTVTQDFQTYIFDGTEWKAFLSDVSIQNAIKDDLINPNTLWSSEKILERITTLSTDHTHTIQEIENLEYMLTYLETKTNEKMDLNEPKGFGTFNLMRGENSLNKIVISNASNLNSSPTKSTVIDETSLSIKNTLSSFNLKHGLTSYISIETNGIESPVMEFKSGEAPKTQYDPIREIDITNKKYVDDKIDNLPDITNFATVEYVDQQDAFKVSKSGDMMTGGLKLEYSSNSFSGVSLRNTILGNPLLEWAIGNNDNNQFIINKYENSNLFNTGIFINEDANDLSLYNNGLSYNGLDLATIEYVDTENIKQDLLIINKVNKTGDDMSGSLKALGLETKRSSYLKLQEFSTSNKPEIEFVNFQYNPGGIVSNALTDPSLILFPADPNNNKPIDIKFDILVYSENNYEKVWHSGNDGAGSELDADTVDGMQPDKFPLNDDTLVELNKKLDKIGGIITGNLEINGYLVVDNEIIGGNTYINSLNVNSISNLNTTNINGLTTISNNNNLIVTGDTETGGLNVMDPASFQNNITIGLSLTSDPSIYFEDQSIQNDISLSYNKSLKEFTVTNENFSDSIIYHEDNLDVFFKNEFINFANGPTDQGKPVVLNLNGKIDPSMLDVSVFYYVGSWTPAPNDEYPDTTNETYGAFWDITGIDPTNGYTFIGGDLAGKTINNADFLVHAVGGWSIMVSEMNPMLYYKLDGTSAITAPFAAGGQPLKNVADGTDAQDAVTINQISHFSSAFYAVDGSNPLTNHFQANGFQLKNISNGTDDKDAASMFQVNQKINIDGSSIFIGDQTFGDGNSGGNIILRASSNVDSPFIEYQRRDGRKFADTLVRNLKDYVISLYDPDDGTPDSPSSVYTFGRDGTLKTNNLESNIISLLDGSSFSNILFKRSDSTRTSQISTDSINLLFQLFSDDGNTLESTMEFTRSGELLLNNNAVWSENNFDPDSKENYLNLPSNNEMILSSDTTGNRVWINQIKEFTALDDTPSDYVGKAGQLIGVNQTEDGLEFGDAGPNLTRHIFQGDGTKTEFVIPGGYLPGNVDVYLQRTRMINAPQNAGGDIDATNGTSIIFYSAPAFGLRIEVAAYVKDSFMIMPNATEDSVGGMRVRMDTATSTVYITTDGTQP
jgi:hypothetical protein